jgi:hypothetical protein
MGSSSQRPCGPNAARGDEGSEPNLTPGRIAREGWSDFFEQAAKAAPDGASLLPDHLNEQWDNEEWTW